MLNTIKSRPFVKEYPLRNLLWGTEFVTATGDIFKSYKEMKEGANQGNLQAKSILFCPHCLTGYREEDFVTAYKGISHTSDVGKCLHCGRTMSFGTAFNDAEYLLKHAGGTKPAFVPTALRWWPVEDNKLAIETVEMLYFARTMYGKYWLHRDLFRRRYVFNLKTGQCYVMRAIDAKGRPSAHAQQKHRLKNATFDCLSFVPETMADDFLRVVLDALREHSGVDYFFEREYYCSSNGSKRDKYICCSHEVRIGDITKVNYFSRMKPSDMADMVALASYNFVNSNKRIFPNLIALSTKGEIAWLPKYMQKRSIRNRLNKRASVYFLYRWLYKCGIRDVNVWNTIVDEYIDVFESKSRLADNFDNCGLAVIARCANPSPEEIEFMRWVLKARSAESACQFIKSVLSNKDFAYSDSVRMFHDLPDGARPNQAAGNLKEIHDLLVVIDRKLKYGNREIKYSSAEKALETTCGEYSFKLAKDTDTLYDIGKAMGICVGSYSNQAVAKKCTILTMQKAERHIACIELTMGNNEIHMVQLKSKYNHTVSEIEPVIQWVERTGVIADCYDYNCAIQHVSNGYNDNCDYHVENPRLAG